jgi:transposase
MNLHRYWSSSYQQCAIKAKCTTDKQWKVTRWEHEDVLDAMQSRLDLAPDSMRIRRQTVEHPYGTIKLWMGSAHFLMRTLTHVSTEMSLHVLAYNLKRVIKILGIKGLMEAIKSWAGLYGGQIKTIVMAWAI